MSFTDKLEKSIGKLRYSDPSGILQTACPYAEKAKDMTDFDSGNQRISVSIYARKIGSAACRRCSDFISDDGSSIVCERHKNEVH